MSPGLTLMMIYHSPIQFCLYIPGVWGECGEPGEVWAGDQVPAASISTRCRYFGNRGGQLIIPIACFHNNLSVCTCQSDNIIYLLQQNIEEMKLNQPTELFSFFRSVKRLKPHSRPCSTLSVTATVTPPLMCRALFHMSPLEEALPQNLPLPSVEPISRRQRLTILL